MLRTVRVWLTILVVLGLGLSACVPQTTPEQGGGGTSPAPSSTHTPTAQQPYPPQSTPVTPIKLATVPPTEELIVGKVPAEVMDKIMADLEQRLGSKPEAVTVVKSEAVTWNDGSLGCPKRGVFYIQVLIEGYWVILQVGPTQYDYHVGSNGTPIVLCEPQ